MQDKNRELEKIKELEKRIEFLELLVSAFSESTAKAINTNNLLLEYMENYYPKKFSTSS